MSTADRGARRLRRSWPQRLLLGFNIFLILACLVTAGGVGYLYYKFGQLPRIQLGHVLTPPSESAITEPQNFLLVGSDTRAVIDRGDPNYNAFGSEAETGGQRADTIMVLRVDPSSAHASLLSIPRDLWVPLRPGSSSREKINGAFNNGPEGLITAIQDNLDIPIHHYVQVDFVGFRSLVDAVGGVPVYFTAPAHDTMTGLDVREAGCINLDGEQALAYARSRHYKYLENGSWRTDPTGDMGRIIRQQDFMRRALKRAVNQGVRNPVVLQRLVDVGIGNVKIDSGLSARDLLDLGMRLRDLDPDSVAMYALPSQPAEREGLAVMLLEEDAAKPVLDIFRGVAPIPGAESAPGGEAPALEPSAVRVRVLNGVGVPGAAGEAAEQLTAAGFKVVGTGDAERTDPNAKTLVGYAAGNEAVADFFGRSLTNAPDFLETEAPNSVDVVLVVGKDFAGVRDTPVEQTLLAPPAETPTTTAPTTTTTDWGGVVAPPEVPCG